MSYIYYKFIYSPQAFVSVLRDIDVSLVASVHRPALLFIRTLSLSSYSFQSQESGKSSGYNSNLVEMFANYQKEEKYVNDAYAFKGLFSKPASPDSYIHYLHCPTT